MGKVAFKLLLPDTARIHPVFLVSQLRKAVGARNVENELPPDLQADGPTFLPLRILDRRQTQMGEDTMQQILVE